MIRLQNVLKMSSRRICDTSCRRFEDVLKTYGQGECIGLDQNILKTSSEDVWLIRIYSSSWRRLEDALKMSFEDENERHLQDVFKTSSLRRMSLPPPKIITLCRVYNITRGFPYTTIVRLGGLQVSSSRIGSVRETIISCFCTSSGTLK